MSRLPALLLVALLALACRPAEEAPPEEEALAPAETPPPPHDFVTDTIGSEGGTVPTPEGFACVDIKRGAVTEAVEVKIKRLTGLETLQPEPYAPRMAGAIAGWEVLPPVYDFSIRRMDGTLPVFKEGDLTFVICAHITHGRDEQEAVLARIQEGVPGAVDTLMRVDSFPAACQMNSACTPRPPRPTQGEALAPLRWLDGSPLTPTPAGAAAHAQFYATGGTGGGPCCSPFAAVLPEATETAQ